MASQLLGIKTRFTNDLGSPLVGGQVYTYFAGTSTNQDTYSDAALTVPNTNPVILDDTGSADIFLKGSYRIRVFDKSGRFIEEQDNVTQAASQGDATEIGERIDAIQIDVSAQKLDTGITATPQGVGMVARTQAQVNAETVSLLDFGAPYSTDSSTHLQAALDYLNNVGGGVLSIPYHTGVLVVSGSVTLYPNITVNCDKNLIIDCTESATGFQFQLVGSIGSELPLSANKTSGDSLIATTSAHSLSVGDDVLIVSQRECAHLDAGALWRLGETTSGANSPFFAEPLVVKSIDSSTSFSTHSPLIFPDYRKDKTLETSLFARASSTIQKMTLPSKFKWLGGIFKKESGSLFHFMWTKDCELDIEVQRGYGAGQEIYNRFSLSNKITAKISRPIDWVLVEGHDKYNSIKDVSSWYTVVNLDEINGCQGLDQSYTTYSGIYPRYKISHINSREDGMTTHGCVYGAVVEVYALNCEKAAFRNRARFVTAKVVADNCNWGLRNSTWGTIDCNFDVQITNSRLEAVTFSDEGITAKTPAVKNSSISGQITMSPASTASAINLGANNEVGKLFVDSKIKLKNLSIRSYDGALRSNDAVNGVTLDNVSIEHFGTSSPIWFRNSAGHTISNLEVDLVNGNGTLAAILASTLSGGTSSAKAYGSPSFKIDYKSCKVSGGQLITSDDRLIAGKITMSGSEATTDAVYINNKNIAPFFKIELLAGQSTENRLVLENSIPIGMEVKLLITKSGTGESFGVYTQNDGVVSYLNDVNDLGGRFISVTDKKLIIVRKIADNEFIVSK